ncbi:MAG TPA: methyltransferase domain-containing protein [Azospirillaceae bacterium]|nr:methyltransferase domain-containing protein [Azospirillaceae bacterium]
MADRAPSQGNPPGAAVFLPVADAYDRWSGLYDSYDNPMVFAATAVIRAGLAGTPGWDVRGADVVEFGCGTGRNLAMLKAHGARTLVGCDLSVGMLAKARARDAAFRLLRHDMAEPLPLPDASADLVLFCLSLEHVGDPGAPLREARRLLRPSGRVAVIEIHPFVSQGGVSAHFRDEAGEVRMPTFAHRFCDHLNAFAGAGLRVDACREWRPRDLGPSVPAKVLKRGPDVPLVVEFSAVPF